jgi:AraC-like DNA-binding protein
MSSAATRTRDWRHLPQVDTFPEREHGVDDALHLGYYRNVRAENGLAVHTHEQAMEFCYLVRGRQSYQVRGRDYALVGGDVFITYPDEPHSTGGAPQDKGVLFWLSVRVPKRDRFWLGLPTREASALRTALLTLRPRSFRGSRYLHRHFDTAMALSQNTRDPLRFVSFRAHLVLLLMEIVRLARCARKTAPMRPVLSLQTIAREIEANVTEPLALGMLAVRAGLSLSRFKVCFKAEFGVPPGEYVLRARIEEAQRRLETSSDSITEIAHALGFSSSQYFATVVKRYTRATPGELRERALRTARGRDRAEAKRTQRTDRSVV